MAALRGVIFRCGIASLPLVAVILLCVIMFNGLGKHKAAPAFTVQTALIPAAEASPLEKNAAETALLSEGSPEKNKSRVLKAAFERLHITHATIRVPD